jgi:hypothetical protein
VRKIGLGSRRGSWWVNFPLLRKRVGRTRRRISYHRTFAIPYFRREGMTFRSLSPSYSKLTRLLVSPSFFVWALSVISLFLKEVKFPGKEEGPKPGNFPVLLLEKPAGEAKLS